MTYPIEMSNALFDAMPSTEPLVIPAIPESGTPSTLLPGSTVGSVLETRDANGTVTGFYVLLPDGVQKITSFVADLLRTANSQGSATPTLVSPDKLVHVPVVERLNVDYYPSGKLNFIDTAANPVTCVAWQKQSTDPQASIKVFSGRGLPSPIGMDGRLVHLVRDDRHPESVEADQTLVLPGAANFVATTSGVATAQSRESLYWVSPQGVRYGIQWDDRTLQALGARSAQRRPGPLADRPHVRSRAGHQPGQCPAGARHHQRRRCGCADPRSQPTGRRLGMSKRGFVRGARKPAPMVPPVRVAVAPPLALPEREPRNILLMIALPALLVGIIGTLVVMYTSGVRSLQSGFFPMMGLAGFGALMFSGRFGRGRRISWGEQEKQRRVYLRQLDEDRDEVQRAAQDQRRSQLFVHGDPQNLDTVIGGPRMWERRPSDSDFLDVRLGIGVQQASDSAVSLQWPEVPIGEELEPVTGGALRDFILEQSKIRGIGKVLSLRSKPGFSFIATDPVELHSIARSILCSLAVYHSPNDVKVMVVTRHPELWSWLVWLPHNQHDEMFDACGLRRLVFISPTELEEALDAELHRKGRGPWAPPVGASPTSMPSAMEVPGLTLGPHWVIVDDNVGTPEQWESVTGQKGMAGITVLRLATRPGVGVGFLDDEQRFELREGRLYHRGAFYAVADMLAETTASRYARALARWSPMSADDLSETDSQGAELLRALGISDPRQLDVDRLWADSRGRGDAKWAMVPVGVKPGGELQYVIFRAKDFGGFGFHSVVVGTSGSGKSEFFLSLCNGIALTHSPETFIVIFVDMKFESAAQDLEGLPHVAGSLSNLGKDDRHLAERMRKAINGEIARRYRLFKEAGARDANEYEEMRLAGRDLEPVPILLVIIDEYLELFHHHQEWIQLVIHIGQEGRGCNVFFTLGGQRLDLSSLSKAKSNIAFRVALRAETAEDSRDVIGSDAALHLPSKENGYALLKVGPRDLEPFRCFYLSAPFVLPKKAVSVSETVDVSFSQPRPLTWEYQPLSDEDTAALATAEAPEEPDEFLFHTDGFRKKKLLDVIRESLVSHPARLPHQIWLPPLEVSEQVDALVAYWRDKPWHVDYGQNAGLVLPFAIVDIPEDHVQRVHVVDAEMDNIMVVGTAQRGKSTTLMTLMTSAALMYRPERVTFFCIGAALYPVEEYPHVAGVVSLNDTEGVSRTIATIEGLIRAREASFKHYQIDISEFRERRFGAAGGGGTDPEDKFGDVFLVIDNYGDLYDKDSAMGDRAIVHCPPRLVLWRSRHDQRHRAGLSARSRAC